MTAIAGIVSPGKSALVDQMLDHLAHRGSAGKIVLEVNGATLGARWPQAQVGTDGNLKDGVAADRAGEARLAMAKIEGNSVTLKRDPLGVAPLYYGKTGDGSLCFASEVKALLPLTQTVYELPPGAFYKDGAVMPYYRLKRREPLDQPPEVMARELRKKLETAVENCAARGEVGAWLSGGLDSSIMAALARPFENRFHTFAAGLPGAPDLHYARLAADFIHSEHHEVIVELEDMLTVLPEVIYHLESFDALLVRSSILNYLVAKEASNYVPAVLSGEGGDELFAGYEYLKELEPSSLADELVDIIGRLHNTALQRVDRSASAHGIVAYVGFLQPPVVEYALQIPAQYKLRGEVEKWILRQAMRDALPEPIVNRAKAKFWEGSGVGELLESHAQDTLSDREFAEERFLPNGWTLNSKEELKYYRIFCDHFGRPEDLSWMGRTKGAPVS